MLDHANVIQKSCEWALSPTKAKVKIKPIENINTPYTDLSPFEVTEKRNTYLYYSQIKDKVTYQYDDYKNEKVYHLYKSQKTAEGWNKGVEVSLPEINDPRATTCNGVFNKYNTRFYFTKCLEVDDDKPLCNLFVADVKGGNFENVRRLPAPINWEEKYSSTQPSVRSVSKESEIVYFVSNRPEGKGGNDIWYTSRNKEGIYKEPQLLKGEFNTSFDEGAPFWEDSSKTLYFVSNGHPGMGGFDIFKSQVKEEGGFSEISNVGIPLNSSADEMYYYKSKDQTYGYIVSNRVTSKPLNKIETASDDIFYFENLNFAVTGLLSMEKNNKPLDLKGATYNLYKKLPDGTKVLLAVDSTFAPKYKGELTETSGRVLLGGAAIGSMNTTKVKSPEVVDNYDPTSDPNLTENQKKGGFFFKLEPDAEYEIEVQRPGFESKTEFISTMGLNEEDTLDKNLGLKKGEYFAGGYAIEKDKQPELKLSNYYVSIEEILPDGQEKIVKEYTTSGTDYSFPLWTEKDYKITVRKDGYFSNNVKFSTKNIDPTQDTIYNIIPLEKIIINKEYALNNVLYEFGKATLTDPSKLIMDTLYGILVENPTFVIELSSHTDNIGSDANNMKLSQARAQSCVDYLISKGILKTRMKPVGYGESKPKVSNTKPDGSDDPEGRATNRRTEFKILKN